MPKGIGYGKGRKGSKSGIKQSPMGKKVGGKSMTKR